MPGRAAPQPRVRVVGVEPLNRHMRPLLTVALLLALAVPAAAQERTASATATPLALLGETTAVVDLRLEVAGGWSSFFHLSVPTDAAGRIGTLTLPAGYLLCHPRAGCERHLLFPGLRLHGQASTESAGPAIAGQGITASRAQTLVATVTAAPGLDPAIATPAGARSRPRRMRAPAGRELRGLRWRGWGSANATARGRDGARISASALVDCGGDLYYSRVRMLAPVARKIAAPAPCAGGRRAQRVHPR